MILTLATVLPSGVQAAWPSDPTVNLPLSTAAGRQGGQVAVSDGVGGAIVAWVDGSTSDIYAQRVDATGMVLWTGNGVAVTTAAEPNGIAITTDGAGGAIIAWSDRTVDAGDIRAQRIDATGTPVWGGTNGVLVCGVQGYQTVPETVPDGAGGIYLVWASYSISGLSNEVDLFAQRLDSTGARQWAAAGVPVCVAPEAQAVSRIVANPAGGFFACWNDERNISTSTDIYAQSIDPSGVAQWTANGIPICTASTPQSIWGAPVSDGAGGFIIAWRDPRGLDLEIYAQRVDPTGTALWTVNGVLVVAAPGDQYQPVMTTDGAGGAILAWHDTRTLGSEHVYAQRVSSAGTPLWSAGGVAVSTTPGFKLNQIKIVSDDAGGAIIAWPDGRGTSYDIYAQRLDGNGVRKWRLNGRPVTTAPSDQMFMSMVSDGSNGAILAWQDPRSDFVNPDIYAQRIEGTGSLSGPLPPTGSIAGRVTTSCPATGTPLEGIAVDAFAVGSGDLLGTGITDANGDYAIDELEIGNYTATLVTPLGYSTTSSESPVTVTDGGLVVADFNVTCIASSGSPRSSGFWKHQFGIAAGGNGNAEIDETTLCGYLDIIEAHFNNNALNQVVVYNPPADFCGLKIEVAKGLLNLGGSPAPIDKAKQQLMALLLNVAANRLGLRDVISKDGATASQAITYCDNLIDDPAGDRTLAAAIAEKINSGQMVNAGVVPLTTEQINYGRGLALRTFRVTPNPGSEARTFQFTVGRAGPVRLNVYDVSGRLVARLANGPMEEGQHAIPWRGTTNQGTPVGRGTYFARLDTDEGAKTLKVIQAK